MTTDEMKVQAKSIYNDWLISNKTLSDLLHDLLMLVLPTAPALNSQIYKGTAQEYITYFYYTEQGEAFAANKVIEEGSYWQIDIWKTSSGIKDIEVIKEQIKIILTEAEFFGFYIRHLYEDDTNTNHVAVRCDYLKNLQ